jgi:ferredoxin
LSAKPKKRKFVVCHFRDRCIGCGACAMVCPKYWTIEDDGKAKIKDAETIKNFDRAEVDLEDYNENKLASELCPTNVIKIDI